MSATPFEQECPPEESLLAMMAAASDSETQQRLHAHIRNCERCFAAVQALASSLQSAPMVAEHVVLPRLALDLGASGSFLGGRFELLRRLGSGGFGDVFLARDTRNARREVALKLLKEKYQDNPLVVHRFEQECASLEWLTHPNIVRVYERGQWQGGLYIVMEYVEGQSLESWLNSHRQHGTLPNGSEVFTIFLQICEAVVFSHNLSKAGGIIHRDLKPANIMLSRRGTAWHVTLLDFGLARIGERRGTWTAEAIGTPMYMAPEQIDNQAEVGQWTDVYALGVILVEMLTLRRRADGNMTFWHAVLNDELGLLQKLRARRPDVSAAVFEAIAPALRPQIAQRYQTSFDLLNAVRQAASRRQPIRLPRDLRTVARYAFVLLFLFLDGGPRLQSQYSLDWLQGWYARNITHSPFSLDLDVRQGSASSVLTIEDVPPETIYIQLRVMGIGWPHGSEAQIITYIHPRKSMALIEIPVSQFGYYRIELVAFNENFGIATGSETMYGQVPRVIRLESCKNGLCADSVAFASDFHQGNSYNAIAGDQDSAYMIGKNFPILSYRASRRVPWVQDSSQKHYLISFFGSGMNSLYAAGGCRPGRPCPYTPRGAVLLHLDPATTTWLEELAPPGAMWLWWGWQAPNHQIWVVGGKKDGRNIVARRDPGSAQWEEFFVEDELIELRDIWGSSSGDVWSLGLKPEGGGTRLLRYATERKRFELQPGVPIDEDLTAIWGAGPSDIWIGTERGSLLHYDGTSWSKAACNPKPSKSAIYNLAGRAWNDIWATGEQGYIARYNGTCWQDISIPNTALAEPGKPTSISGLWVRGSDVWLLSGSGDRMHFRYAALPQSAGQRPD